MIHVVDSDLQLHEKMRVRDLHFTTSIYDLQPTISNKVLFHQYFLVILKHLPEEMFLSYHMDSDVISRSKS